MNAGDTPLRLQWPGPYEAHIVRVLKSVPQVTRLLDLMNTKFEVQTRAGPETIQGDSTTIFGGFLRWIVSEVSSGRKPTLRGLIAEGSDIDIAVNHFEGPPGDGCADRLVQYFRSLVREGCVIEYAGMTYGSDSITNVNIDLRKKSPSLPYGSYMVWVPVKIHSARVPNVATITSSVSLRKPGVSFADAVKSRVEPAFSTTVGSAAGSAAGSTVGSAAGVPMDLSIDAPAQTWIRLDINYGSRAVADDFTVNALNWPCKARDGWSVCIADIIARQIIPTNCTSLKLSYRLIKLYRRGYKFGVGDPSDHIELCKYLRGGLEITTKNRQNSTRELIRRAFTTDMSRPSVSPSSHIVTTRHEPTVISMDWIRSLPEYSKLLRDDSTLGEFHVVDNATNDVASTADDNHDQVLVTTQPTRAFKLVNIAGCELHVLCALDIPVGTRYIPQGDITMYEHATIAGLYGYPRVRIDEHVRENKLNIVSMYDKNFHYAIAGEIVREVVAMSDGAPAALKIGSGVGIYTYATMISAWNHVSLSFAYIAPE